MPKVQNLSLPCRSSHYPFASSSSKSTLKVSSASPRTYSSGPQIFCTSSVSSDSDSEPPSPSSPDTPVTAALAPQRRSPPPGTPRPVMRASTSSQRRRREGTPDEIEDSEYILSVNLPGFMPEMVTVSARRDDRLAVIADMWHAEVNCTSFSSFLNCKRNFLLRILLSHHLNILLHIHDLSMFS